MSGSDARPSRALFTEPSPPRPTHRLVVQAGNPMAEIFVADAHFNLVARGHDSLDVELPEGGYAVKVRLGERQREHWVQLDADRVETLAESTPPGGAPVRSRSSWDPEEREVVRELCAGTTLAVVVRDPEASVTVADQVSLRTVGGRLCARLAPQADAAPGWRIVLDRPAIGFGGDAEPGCYILRIRTPFIGSYEVAVWVAPGFHTRVLLSRGLVGSGTVKRHAPHFATAAVEVVRPGLPEDLLRRLEEMTGIVRGTIANERPVLPFEDIAYAVEEEGQSPMLALLGAHLLRLIIDRAPSPDDASASQARSLLDRVLPDLARLLPGWPDVGALLPVPAASGDPPMLRRSWAMIAPGASVSTIPPGSYASRIAPAVTTVRPWLVWRRSKMLPATGHSTVDVARFAAVKRTLEEGAPRTRLANFIRQTPIEAFDSVENLSGAWKIPVSSLGATLASLEESEE